MNHHHPLIEKSHNFVLDRKVLFIDSNDRDIQRWPNSSEFEINCPEIYNNVESLRLLNIQLPSFFFNISERLQTNKMIIEFEGLQYTITLTNGYYNHDQLTIALEKLIIRETGDSDFIVTYNVVNRKFYFGHRSKEFKFLFDINIDYDKCPNDVFKDSYKTDIYAQHSKWGLGFLLGFNKTTYTSSIRTQQNDPKIIGFDHETVNWIGSGSHVLVPPNPSDLENNQFIYVELEKYNKCDEIKPFLYYNYNNANSGIVNSAFAKIPIVPSPNNQCLINDGYLENISYYQPPIEKIAKLKVKFRYHNGMLVDFQSYNVSFAIEINQIRNEMNNYNVRTPYKL